MKKLFHTTIIMEFFVSFCIVMYLCLLLDIFRYTSKSFDTYDFIWRDNTGLAYTARAFIRHEHKGKITMNITWQLKLTDLSQYVN